MSIAYQTRAEKSIGKGTRHLFSSQAAVIASIVAGLLAVAVFAGLRMVTPESMVAVVLVSGAALGVAQIFAHRKTAR